MSIEFNIYAKILRGRSRITVDTAPECIQKFDGEARKKETIRKTQT
jgi:hypothetical protein